MDRQLPAMGEYDAASWFTATGIRNVTTARDATFATPFNNK
jgi:hypothetical protein